MRLFLSRSAKGAVRAPKQARNTRDSAADGSSVLRVILGSWLLLALPSLQAAVPPAIETGLAERMRKHATPGLSIAVVDGGRIAWAKGYGVREQNPKKTSPVTNRTLFQMASISKPVAAVGALRMVERGQLSLDEDVNRKLSSWKLPANDFTARQPVTLRHLLSHTAGIRSGPLQGYTAFEPLPSLLDLLRGHGEQRAPLVRVDFLPGSQTSYSNGAFLVVQQLMTDAAGKPFPDLMRELVLKRAGMKRSTYQQGLPRGWVEDVASGHREDGWPIPGHWHSYPEQAAVGLWSTPSDLARLAIELSRELNGKSRKLLTHRMAQEMFRRQAGNFGLGWILEAQRAPSAPPNGPETRGLALRTAAPFCACYSEAQRAPSAPPNGPETRGLALRTAAPFCACYSEGEGNSFSFRHDGSNEGYRSAMIYYPRLGKGAVLAGNSDLSAELLDEVMHLIAGAYRWPALPVTHPPNVRS